MIAKLVTTGVFNPPAKMIFRHTPEVEVHVYGQISGQKYEFPAFAGKITHAHAVCIRPFLLLLMGTRLYKTVHGCHIADLLDVDIGI